MISRTRPIGTVAYLGGLPALLEPFTWAWGQLIQYSSEYLCAPGEYLHLDHATISLHDAARNGLAAAFLGDWLVMLDTDHTFEPDLLVRLLTHANAHQVDVATALYRHRAWPGSPVMYQWDDRGMALPIGDWDRTGTVTAVEIGSAGCGCCFIRRAVFDRIAAELQESPFTRVGGYGEDHAFFRRCFRLGIPVYAFPAIEAPHLAIVPQRIADYTVPRGYTLHRMDVAGKVLV